MMHKMSEEKPTDLQTKLVFWTSCMDGSWNYTLAYYKDGRWYDECDDDDITCPGLEFWADVELPGE